MKSFKQWKHRQRYFEFVGPAGQIDPQGMGPNPAVPQMAPVATFAVDPSQVPPAAPAAPNSMDDMGGMGSVGAMMQRTLKALSTKPPQQIIAAQQAFNTAVQQMLQDKSTSAARKGVMSGFNAFKQARMNFGKDGQQPQIPG